MVEDDEVVLFTVEVEPAWFEPEEVSVKFPGICMVIVGMYKLIR